MNIFALSDDPVKAAQWQHDKHVVKMTLETAQLLSQAVRLNPQFGQAFGDTEGLYKSTHIHHPSSVWCRDNLENFQWLVLHGLALADEYRFRFKRDHKAELVIREASKLLERTVSNCDQTPFPMAMPDEYKTDDPVLSYRLYYLAEKIHPDSKWTNRCRRDFLPPWLSRAVLFAGG